jgi:hypothetical protein
MSPAAGKFADTIVSEIWRKVRKYGKSHGRPLDLLTYITHWRFLPSAKVFQLVAHHLKAVSHPFAHVNFLCPLNDRSAALVPLFPDEGLLRSFHEKSGASR